MDIGPSELIIILVIVLLLFGGSRLAGVGKSAGRALKEFKEETRELTDQKVAASGPAPIPTPVPSETPVPPVPEATPGSPQQPDPAAQDRPG